MSEAVVNASPAAIDATGWFGKMPNLGDFVSRRLPDHFIKPWDDWLQLGLATARAEFGEAWRDHYLVAPVHRFWLAPGLLGSTAWAGVLMPSVDAVGRHFPLTVARSIDVGEHEAAASLADALAAADWFDHIDSVARMVLDIHFSADDFDQELSRVEQGSATPADPTWLSLANALVAERARSVWWREESVELSQFECFASLPPASALAALLTSS